MMGKYIKNSHEDAVTHLNNFFCYFRCSKIPGYPDGNYRTSFKRSFPSKPLFIEMVRATEDSEEGVAEYCSIRSDKKLNQTWEEFCFEIDTTATEVGIDLDTVSNLIFDYKKLTDLIQARKARERLNEYIYPAYLALRRKGYNPIDLNG